MRMLLGCLGCLLVASIANAGLFIGGSGSTNGTISSNSILTLGGGGPVYPPVVSTNSYSNLFVGANRLLGTPGCSTNPSGGDILFPDYSGLHWNSGVSIYDWGTHGGEGKPELQIYSPYSIYIGGDCGGNVQLGTARGSHEQFYFQYDDNAGTFTNGQIGHSKTVAWTSHAMISNTVYGAHAGIVGYPSSTLYTNEDSGVDALGVLAFYTYVPSWQSCLDYGTGNSDPHLRGVLMGTMTDTGWTLGGTVTIANLNATNVVGGTVSATTYTGTGGMTNTGNVGFGGSLKIAGQLQATSIYAVPSSSYLAAVNFSGNAISYNTLTYDLGDSTHFWRTLYCSNAIFSGTLTATNGVASYRSNQVAAISISAAGWTNTFGVQAKVAWPITIAPTLTFTDGTAYTPLVGNFFWILGPNEGIAISGGTVGTGIAKPW